jgi:uncharacterized RDD family membrane protein YckC
MQNSYASSPRVGEGAIMRGVALLIDIIILAIVGVVIQIVLGETAGGCVSFIVGLIYWIGMPVYRGGTIGKLALGMVIIKEDGSPVDLGASAIRYLLYIVDFFPYIIPGLTGAVLISTSPTKQRLGDRVAKTLVVKKDAVGAAGAAAPTQRF